MTALVAFAVLGSQTGQVPAPTYDSHFVMHNGAAYVGSPIYPLAFKGDRVSWSADSTRVAFVAPVQYAPSRFARAAAKGEVNQTESVFLWNAESGKVSEILTPKDPSQGFDKIEFVGKTNDLVVSTFWGSTVEDTRYGIVYVRDGGTPYELPLGETKGLNLAISRTEPAILVISDKGAFHVLSGSVAKADLPEEVAAIFGLAADGTAQLTGRTEDGAPRFYAYDFSTRRVTMLPEPKNLEQNRVNSPPPFFFDTYRPTGFRKDTSNSEENLSVIDQNVRLISYEDGSVRMDVVEKAGEKRRRFPFIWEMSAFYTPSPDGLSVAFQSQGLLCVRSLIRCDAETTAKLTGQK